MGKNKTLKGFDDLRRMTYGGAVAVKSTDLLAHARNTQALQGDITGFASLGVAGAMSEVAARPLQAIYGGRKRKKKRR